MNDTVTVNKAALANLLQAQLAYEKTVNAFLSSLSFEPPAPQKDEWISTREVRAITGISKEKLCRMARNGECAAKRVGSDWRFPRSKVEDMTFIKDDTAVSR